MLHLAVRVLSLAFALAPCEAGPGIEMDYLPAEKPTTYPHEHEPITHAAIAPEFRPGAAYSIYQARFGDRVLRSTSRSPSTFRRYVHQV